MSRVFSVLLVEDDDPLRSVLCELLRQWGCQVHSVDRGPAAIDLARRVSIDFSILDMHLPGMNGVEVFRTLRRELGSMPSILMSGDASAEEAQRALELGMFEFLRKPLDMQALRQTFDLLVRHYFDTQHPGRSPRSQRVLPPQFPDPRRRPPGPRRES